VQPVLMRYDERPVGGRIGLPSRPYSLQYVLPYARLSHVCILKQKVTVSSELADHVLRDNFII